MISDLLIWPSGYSWGLANQVTSPLDRSKLRKQGTGIVMSSLVAAASAGTTTLWATASLNPYERAICFGAAASAAAALVLTYDRAVVFSYDICSIHTWQHRLRWPLIIILAAFAALKLTTWVFPDDLQLISAHQKEELALQRAQHVSAGLQMAELSARLTRAEARVEDLREAATSVPGTIETRLASARQCQAAVELRRHAFVASGLTARQARLQTQSSSRICNIQYHDAKVVLDQYQQGVQTDLGRARGEVERADTAVANADEQGKSLNAAGARTDEKYLTSNSLAVVLRLLGNPLAAAAFLVFWGLLAVADGMGMITSGVVGRTAFGHWIEGKYATAVAGAEEAKAQAAARSEEAWTIKSALSSGADSPRAHAAWENAGARHMEQAAGIVACAKTVEQLVESALRVAEAKERVQRLSPEMPNLFDDMLDGEIRRTRFRIHDVEGVGI